MRGQLVACHVSGGRPAKDRFSADQEHPSKGQDIVRGRDQSPTSVRERRRLRPVGGLSTNVATYFVSAMILGVYFALNSGTVDSLVYDAVLEQTGTSETYEMWIGRIRIVEALP